MQKYKQQKDRINEGFGYEYWWVTNNFICGYRLMKVRIPPKIGPCSNWKYEFYNLEDLGTFCKANTIHTEEQMKDWSWIKYIKEPKLLKK